MGTDSDCEGLLFNTNACPKEVWIAPKPKRVTRNIIDKKLRFLLNSEKIGLEPSLRINISLGKSYRIDYFIIAFFLVQQSN